MLGSAATPSTKGVSWRCSSGSRRLMPILNEVGINPGEPEVLEVHNTIKGWT